VHFSNLKPPEKVKEKWYTVYETFIILALTYILMLQMICLITNSINS
jgi:hypothetical protein